MIEATSLSFQRYARDGRATPDIFPDFENSQMKRASDGPGNSKEKVFRRQDPVSCQFCRAKKLKCDRQTPCSNCTARRITCVSASGAVSNVDESSNPANSSPTPASTSQDPAVGNDIDARLRRLEQLLLAKTNDKPEKSPVDRSSDAHSQGSERLGDDGDVLKTADLIETAAGIALPYDYLSGSDFKQNLGESLLLAPLTFGPPTTAAEISECLPVQAAARILVTHYVENINWVYHIIHAPTVYHYMDTIYARLAAGQKPEGPQLGLVCAIIAVSAFFWSGSSELTLSKEDAKSYCNRWGALAQRVLHETHHLTRPTVETLQATILLSQYLPSFPQTASRSAALGTLVNVAHILQLHQTDSPRKRKLRADNGCDLVDLEIRRRLWWHLAATDWILSFMSGPQYGTYIIHPDQMRVSYPSNVDDSEVTPTSISDKPFNTTPTEMTYTLGKIRLAELIREIADEANKAGVDMDELEYDKILYFDKKFQDNLLDLPYFFRLDDASRKRSLPIEKERPYIAWERNMCHFGFHTRLSRLHRPYLARGYKDPRYAYSRMMCLRSARMVIELERNMREIPGGFSPNQGRLWIIIHHVFVATITLVMDFCCHRDDPQAEERKKEILDCYKILEESQEESPMARQGLADLKKIMRDWRTKSQRQSQPGKSVEDKPDETYLVDQVPFAGGIPYGGRQHMIPWNAVGPSFQEPAMFTGNMQQMGPDNMQDLWLNPFDFDTSFDPQWESLFRDLENGQSGAF